MLESNSKQKQMGTYSIAQNIPATGGRAQTTVEMDLEPQVPLEKKRDDVLITLFQSGEEHVFRYLVERYMDRVRNIIYSILREQDAVDDLAQEVFIKVYEALPRFRFESSFYTWVYRITVNKTRDELRRRKVRRMFSMDAVLERPDRELSERLSTTQRSSEASEIVTRSLQLIPEKFRTPIVLKDLEGMSYEEIADVLQCRIGTVKSRLSRGRSMLRKVLKPLLEEV